VSVLSVRDLGKSFRSYSSEWHRFARWFGMAYRPSSEHWVLRHINFEIQAGEAIGILGQNGAGKSTLLKMITGTLQPSEGEIQVNGRISAILELGMGFNPELTGRQNAFHAVGLMGFGAEQIHQVIPEIEAFAEIGEYFDEPVRTYSSGMRVRVAFSVAIAFRPDILIVDEALSVGDSYFKHKCMTRIREFQDSGTSLLLVSHDIGTIKTVCNRALLFGQGTLLKEGAADLITDYYNALIATKENSNQTIIQERGKGGWLKTKSGTQDANIASISLLDAATKEDVSVARVSQDVELRIRVKIHSELPKLTLGLMIRDVYGTAVWGINTSQINHEQSDLKKDEEINFSLTFSCTLGPGSYSFSTALCGTDTHIESNYEWIENSLVFDVVNIDKPTFHGLTWLDPTILIEREYGESESTQKIMRHNNAVS